MVQAAALSFAAAFHADEPCEYQFDLATLLPDAFETAWIRRDGKLVTPDMPGLGISVREESLAKYSATRESWQAGSLARSVTGMRADEGEGQLPLQDRIVPNGASVETLFDGGADFTEGVAAGPDGLIYFSDITRTAMRRGNNPEAGHIWRFDPRDGSCRIFRSPSGMSNGIVFDSLGRMVVAEGADHGGRRITRTDPASGRSFILAAEYAGKRLNSPNDVTVDSEDRIWFTDPRYLGTEPFEQPLMAVYRIEHSGEVRRVVTDARKPNGVALSPDQRTLYVSSADAGTLDGPGTGGLPLPDGESRVLAYDLDDRGTASGRRLLVDLRSMGHPDGMTLDEEGFLYVAVASRHEPQILVLSPEGSAAARIAMPAVPTNVEFGRGPDRNLLYVTAGSGLYRIRLARAGFRWPDRPAGDGPTSQQQPEASR
jgi:gluconolactonase